MIRYDTKCKCLECGVILSKKYLEDKKYFDKYNLRDYIFQGDFGIAQLVRQHWKDEEYYYSYGIACQENMCGEMVPLDDNGNPIKCFMCESDIAPYETKLGQACNKCVLKSLDKEDSKKI